MPGIVEFPKIIRDAVEEFGAAFENERQRKHFASIFAG